MEGSEGERAQSGEFHVLSCKREREREVTVKLELNSEKESETTLLSTLVRHRGPEGMVLRT